MHVATGEAPVEAVAVRGGAVAAVGTDVEVAGLAGPTTRVVDLGGRTVVPGLIDSHLHVVRGGLTWTQELLWFEVGSLDEALDMIRSKAATTPPGSWIRVVGGWQRGQFRERRDPTREELTALAPAHPVYVQLLYEEAVLNDAGLRAAGIDRHTPDPERGSFERDPDTGEPTGTVRGIGAFMHCLGQGPAMSHEDQVASTDAMLRHLAGYGLTGLIDAGGLGMTPDSYKPVFDLWRRGPLPAKLRLYVCAASRGGERDEIAAWVRHTRPGFGDPWLQHIGVGEVAHFGCHDLEGLTDFAVADAAKDELEQILLDVARAGSPLHMHAVLDATTSAILDVWERVAAQVPVRDLRWSLAHAEPISDHNLDRVARLGAGIAVQDRLVYRATDSARVWGEDAVRGGPPLRKILDRGIPLGAGTDATRVASPNPWVSLWWLVTGRTYDEGPERVAEQCLTREEALHAYTRGSAWFSVEEHDRGALHPGMAADLAVLDDDYFSVADDDIRRLTSELTVVEGRVSHASGDFDGLAD
ncbi:MAG TPA: amidohydrolase [Egicoccus sp.]|nr:amidohydrolase [Egicoccus sp.]HSK23048.1 amidohydrolase [Egicoccus sp.]